MRGSLGAAVIEIVASLGSGNRDSGVTVRAWAVYRGHRDNWGGDH